MVRTLVRSVGSTGLDPQAHLDPCRPVEGSRHGSHGVRRRANREEKRGLDAEVHVQPGRGLSAAAHLQLLQDMMHVVLDRGGADCKLTRDVLVGATLLYES